ncbi:MAG TPA: S8 family serine peptidase, partial [Candidatus Eisenbacteria bacterium]
MLDKLTDQSRRASRVPASWRYREELAGGVTGLAAVDRVLGDGGVRAIRRALIEPANVAEAERLGVGRWLMVELSSPRAAEIVERLSRLHEVEAATLDYRAFPAVVPLDPLHSIHWGHNNTAQMLSYNWTNQNHETGSPVGRVRFDANAEAAWDGTQGYGSNSVIIAIIDSGVEADHPDVLQVAGYDFGDNDPDPDDNCSPAPPCGGRGHGTACAGIAAARTNGLGTAGIAAGCRVMPLKVANSSCCIYYTPLANAIMYAADHGANIISMSLGAAISNHGETDAAIDYAYNAGCTILAATGNENASTVLYPAIHANVIGVGAASPCGERKRSSSNPNELNPGVYPDPNGYTCDGERFWGSNYGSTTKDAAGAVDVIAPTILPTTDLQGSAGYSTSDYYKWFNGTSCATPYAAGVCALIKSANSTWTPAQIRDRLLTTAQDVVSVESGAGWDRYAGHGMVDAAAAVGVNVAFTDVTVEANVVTTDVGPAAWEDFDNDGDLDLFVAEGPHRWYRNDGAGHFTPFSVTSESYGAFVGVAVGDFTGDGFSDVYVVGTIDNENELFRNTGAGGFLRMATYGAPIGFGTGQDASWVDFDGDGDLDLYQTVNDIDLVANRLFRND